MRIFMYSCSDDYVLTVVAVTREEAEAKITEAILSEGYANDCYDVDPGDIAESLNELPMDEVCWLRIGRPRLEVITKKFRVSL